MSRPRKREFAPLNPQLASITSENADEILISQALAKLEELDRLRDELKRKNGIDFYNPNKFQYNAHRSKARHLLCIAGNRAGKTHLGCAELVWALLGNYPPWFPQERKLRQPVKGVVSFTSFQKVFQVFEPKFKSLMPYGTYQVKRTSQGYIQHIQCNNGSTVDVLTLEMDDMAYESVDWDIAWEDEPQDKRKRDGILRGLIDRHGIEIITFTPLTEPWMKEELVDRADGKTIDVVFGSTWDNLETINGEQVLSAQSIKEFETSLPDDIRETRIGGQFFHLRGVVYKEFGHEHVLEDAVYQYPDPVLCILDPHDRQPHHLIWAYVDRDDDIIVHREQIVRMELDDLAKHILNFEQRMGYKMRKRIIDPNFGHRPSKIGSNYSVMNELNRNRCTFVDANDSIELGHMLVRDLLHYDKSKPISHTNKPKLFFSKEVPVTIRSMKNLQFEDWRGVTANTKDQKETEQKKDSHGADCVRYLVVSRPTFDKLNFKDDYELETSPY